MVSLMVKLHCESFAEKFLIPAFRLLLPLLYPFSWSNNPRKATAAAAGGCVLFGASAYARIGGYAAIRGELIDDCALAAAVKKSGGRSGSSLTQGTESLRPYPEIADIWSMVARTAYTQLHYSPLLLAGTVLGLVLTYLAPVLLALCRGYGSAWGWLAWIIMAAIYAPMLRFYGAAALGAVASARAGYGLTVYLGATIASAWRHWRGRGGRRERAQWQRPAVRDAG